MCIRDSRWIDYSNFTQCHHITLITFAVHADTPVQVWRRVIGGELQLVGAGQLDGAAPPVEREVQRVADAAHLAGARRDVSRHVTATTHTSMRAADVVEQTPLRVPAARTATRTALTGGRTDHVLIFVLDL